MACEHCETTEAKKNLVYEDEKIIAVVPEKPATKGHIRVIPKKHHESMQAPDDKELEHLFYAASFAATSLFENLEAEGTNIIANTGGELKRGGHFHIDVLARKEKDSLNFLWTPKKLPEPEMKEVAAKIKDKCDLIGSKKTEKKVLDLDKKSPEKIGTHRPEPEKKAEQGDTGKEKEGTEPEDAAQKQDKKPDQPEQKKDIEEDDENYLTKQLRRIP